VAPALLPVINLVERRRPRLRIALILCRSLGVDPRALLAERAEASIIKMDLATVFGVASGSDGLP